MAFALQRPRRGANSIDVNKSAPAEEVGSSIAFCLRTKGFCLVGDACDSEVLQRANAEVSLIDEEEKLEQPHFLVQDGLLGSQGSAKIFEMPSEVDFASEPASDSEALVKLDYMMWSLLQTFAPYQGSADLACTSRSAAIVHQTGDTFFGDIDLSDIDADKWCTVFVRQKVLVLVFLGTGSLELAPYDDDAIPIEVSTYPGLVVLLRTDQLTFSYNSNDTTSVLSCFYMQDNILRMHTAVRKAHMQPPAIALEEHIIDRLKELKSAETESTVYGDDVPRSFILAMNHQLFTQQMTAVPGVGTKFPNTWDAETFFRGIYCTGCDIITTVPPTRWDHESIYDASETPWLQQPAKTNCNHASFIEGAEYFDTKMFSLSPNEARSMDPNQRLVLECAYEALFNGGLRKKQITNSACGVYVGTAASDWGMAMGEAGSLVATGTAASITAGRLSFCLGLKGACLSIDTEAAASMTATILAAESVQEKGKGRRQEFSLGIGTHLNFIKSWWPVWSCAGMLCPGGRCFTFDESANGYVMSEGCGAIMVRLLKETIDGEDVEVVEDKPIGIFAGAWSTHSGKSASLTTPSAPAMEECFRESAKQARIQTADIDAVELFGAANFLSDLVEATMAQKAFRFESPEEPVLATASKTNTGNGIEMAGMYQICKCLYATQRGVSPPNLHLKVLNPHIEFQGPTAFSNESLSFRMSSCYQSIFARGLGGANVNIVSFGRVDETIHPPPKVAEDFLPKLIYWPCGGGTLDFENLPSQGYFISGTWNEWAVDQRMEEEGDGVYGCTVTLDEKGWEQFNIMIDGDPSKLLHPDGYKASKGTVVLGPDDLSDAPREQTWCIDGRPQYLAYGLADDVGEAALAKQEAAQERLSDEGLPGTQFRIRLHIAGKYQTVSWSKCGFKELQDYGRYYLLTDAGAWSLSDAVQLEDRGGGNFQATITMSTQNFEFVIVRNKDMSQAIYPLYKTASAETAQVVGPDELSSETCWILQTRHYPAGYRVTIELEVPKGERPKIRWRLAA